MPSTFDRHPKITITVIVLILFVLMDFSLSIVYNKVIKNRERTGLGIRHPVYHHDFVKNGVSRENGRLGDYTIYTNSIGFKDKSNRKIDREFDGKRIVLMGDSFTEGILLNYEDTFAGIIDSSLSNKNIEVLNAGRVSYSPIIYWKKINYLIEEKKLKFDELVAFVDISDIDDEASYYELSEEGNVIYQPAYQKKAEDIVRDYGLSWISNNTIRNIKIFVKSKFVVISFILDWVHDLLFDDTHEIEKPQISDDKFDSDSLQVTRDYSTWDYILNDYRSNWTFDDKYYNQFGERGKKRMIKYMNLLKNVCDENDIKMTVVVYPWPSQIWYEDLNSRHVRTWQKWCDENDVDFINLFPLFIKLNAPKSEKLKIMNKYFVPYDLHYNKNGNRLVAEEFLKYYFN